MGHLGHNKPPVAAEIELAFSLTQLAQDHAELADRVHALTVRADALVTVDNDEDNAAAAGLVIELRDLIKVVDETAAATKKPVWDAGKNVDSFFNGLNNSASGKRGPLSAAKVRLEQAINALAFRRAAEERRLREEAAKEAKRKADEAAAAAAKAEAEKAGPVAGILLDHAVKQEEMADKIEASAQGPVQDLARQHTAAGVTGTRAEPGFEIVDREALRASLGPLGQSFSLDAVEQAIRKFRTTYETLNGKMPFRDDDQDSPLRYVVCTPPLPGVAFFISYKGMVRA